MSPRDAFGKPLLRSQNIKDPTMKKLTLILCTACLVTLIRYDAITQTVFQRTYGEATNNEGYSVQQTSDGGYIIAGWTSPSGAGIGSDVYLIKTNSLGDTLWRRTYGGTSQDVGYCVRQTSDSGYIITGSTSSLGVSIADVYLIKINSQGDTLWTKTYGGVGTDGSDIDVGRSVQQTSDGGYIIAGLTYSSGAGSGDVYLIKTDSRGDTLWTRTFGGGAYDEAHSVQHTSDGGFVIAGFTNSFGAGSADVYLIKTNSLGDTLWTRSYGGGSFDIGNSVQQTSDSGYILAGTTYSSGGGTGSDVYLIRTNPLGDTLWTRVYSGTSNDAGNSVQQTSDSGFIVTGWTSSSGAVISDVYLIKTNSIGDTLWTRTYGGISDDQGFSVGQTADGGYIVAGWTSSFDLGTSKVYLIKADPNGNIVVAVSDPWNTLFLPETFILKQNYPNPFNPATTIEFELPRTTHVRLSIFNIFGQEIATLVDEVLTPGVKSVSWDAHGLSSGVYFYRFSAGTFSDAKRLLLLK
jgi:regulation of enolase protein 1 (concanavalin A-like superfamily)